MNKVLHGDCLELMKDVPTGSVDMILCDLPYGTTACKWDTIIPFEPLWEQYKRIIKSNGAIVLTASQPFTSKVVSGNIKNYKHHWIWLKEKGTGFQVAKFRPMMATEDIIVFSKGSLTYNPQLELRDKPLKYRYPKVKSKSSPLSGEYLNKVVTTTTKYPENILFFKTERGIHPTQKPVALFEYLIKTYTNEGETVMDNCAGSGTTAIACINTNRNYILMEKDDTYYQTILKRIENHKPQLKIAV